MVQIHAAGEETMMECFPVEGLPYEYGGKAGAMRDLNGERSRYSCELSVVYVLSYSKPRCAANVADSSKANHKLW